jgi:AcrR family transcriptional regulator
MAHSKSALRTITAIETAFLKILSEKPFEKISVTEIIDTSGYSKATFYKYYTDKYDFAEKLRAENIAKFIEVIQKSVKSNAPANDETSAHAMLFSMYKYVEDHKTFFNAVIREKIPGCTADQATNQLYHALSTSIVLTDTDRDMQTNMDLLYYMIANNIIAAIKYWDEHDYILTAEDMTDILLSTYKVIGFYDVDTR